MNERKKERKKKKEKRESKRKFQESGTTFFSNNKTDPKNTCFQQYTSVKLINETEDWPKNQAHQLIYNDLCLRPKTDGPRVRARLKTDTGWLGFRFAGLLRIRPPGPLVGSAPPRSCRIGSARSRPGSRTKRQTCKQGGPARVKNLYTRARRDSGQRVSAGG